MNLMPFLDFGESTEISPSLPYFIKGFEKVFHKYKTLYTVLILLIVQFCKWVVYNNSKEKITQFLK